MNAPQPFDTARDEAIRNLATNFFKVAGGEKIDVAVAAAVLFMATQCEMVQRPDFDQYTAAKLRQVADILHPPA